jgi:MFS family permease
MVETPPPSIHETAIEAAAEKLEAAPGKTIVRGGPESVSAGGTFAAMSYPNYRLWFYGQMASLVGTWMQSTAQGYLVFQLTHSPVFLGYVAFASGAPTWMFTLFGGVVTDRMSRRNLMVITQSAMLVLAFILAALTFTGTVQPWHIILLAFLLGIANAFDAPARQAIVIDLVARTHLANAVALNAAMFNMAVAIGPAIAGLAYAVFGPGWCFTINGISFIAVIIALVLMKLAPFTPRIRTVSAMAELKEGLKYVAGHPSIRVLMLIVGSASLLGIGYMTLIPAWAVDILKGDATTNGLLQSARGIGALAGALMMARLATYRFKGRLVLLGMLVYPALLLVFAWVRAVPAALLLLVGIGWGFMTMTNTCNNLVQHLVKDELRGRVMGIYSLVFFGLMPIGALLAGALAGAVGSPLAVEISAGLALAFAIGIWAWAPHLLKVEA